MTSETNAAVDLIFGFTSRPFDDASGKQNNLYRWYGPELKQWLSEDPIVFRGGDPSLRRYVSNSPLMSIDPSGLVDPDTVDAFERPIPERQPANPSVSKPLAKPIPVSPTPKQNKGHSTGPSAGKRDGHQAGTARHNAEAAEARKRLEDDCKDSKARIQVEKKLGAIVDNLKDEIKASDKKMLGEKNADKFAELQAKKDAMKKDLDAIKKITVQKGGTVQGLDDIPESAFGRLRAGGLVLSFVGALDTAKTLRDGVYTLRAGQQPIYQDYYFKEADGRMYLYRQYGSGIGYRGTEAVYCDDGTTKPVWHVWAELKVFFKSIFDPPDPPREGSAEWLRQMQI